MTAHIPFLGIGYRLDFGFTANDTESVRLAERFAAAAQVMLAALAREDLVPMVQTQINIRIVERGVELWTSNGEPPSNRFQAMMNENGWFD